MRSTSWMAVLLASGCGPEGGADTTDDTDDATPTAGGNAVSGTAGDVTMDIADGVAIGKIVAQAGMTYVTVTLGEGTSECPSMVHPGDGQYLRIGLQRTDGGTFEPGTYTSDDAAVTLTALTRTYSPTCATMEGLQLGGGPSSVTFSEVGDTIAGTFSLTMVRTTQSPEKIGVITGSFSAPACESFGERCEF